MYIGRFVWWRLTSLWGCLFFLIIFCSIPQTAWSQFIFNFADILLCSSYVLLSFQWISYFTYITFKLFLKNISISLIFSAWWDTILILSFRSLQWFPFSFFFFNILIDDSVRLVSLTFVLPQRQFLLTVLFLVYGAYLFLFVLQFCQHFK